MMRGLIDALGEIAVLLCIFGTGYAVLFLGHGFGL